jgi:hypothetical protein
MTRRWFLGILLAILLSRVAARSNLGDENWLRSFRSFLKLFNSFVEQLNDGKFDLRTWQRMRGVDESGNRIAHPG